MKARIREEKGPYFVVNMHGRSKEGLIERGSKPTMVHATIDSAFMEAHRLAMLHTRGRYTVFEAIGTVLSPRKKKRLDENG